MSLGAIASLTLNIIIAALLAATIAYCWVLNRRIKILQDSKSELAQLLRHFDESTERASESIIALQTASKKIGENIQNRIDKANYILDDLAFMLEKGSKLADKLEAGVAVDRARSKAVVEEREQAMVYAEPEEEYLPPPVKAAPPKPVNNRDRTAASLESVLERVVGRTANPKPVKEPAATSQPATTGKPRSKMEQELLDLIRSGVRG